MLLLLFSAGQNQLMLECLGECGKEQQTMNQGQRGFYSEDPGWVPRGPGGHSGWPLLETGARAARDSGV